MKKKCKGGELGPPQGGDYTAGKETCKLVIVSVNDVVIISAAALNSITRKNYINTHLLGVVFYLVILMTCP